MNKWTILGAACFLLFGCNYNLSKNNNEPSPLIQKIVTPEQITFKIVNELVIDKACLKCHSAAGGNRGGINLEGYENVFKKIQQIRKEISGATMPPSQKLTEEEIKLVIDWIDAGASENGKIAGEIPTPKPIPVPAPTPNPTPAPVPTKATFDAVFKQVIKTNCLKCHSEVGGNRGDINLETYENVFTNRKAIKFEVERALMPTSAGTPLTEEQKKLILTWIEQGSLK